MAVGAKQVEMSIVVVVEEERSPAEMGDGRFPDARRVGNIRENRAAISSIHNGEGTAMFSDNSMRERQAYSVAMRFGSENGNKDLFEVRRRNAWASIAN